MEINERTKRGKTKWNENEWCIFSHHGNGKKHCLLVMLEFSSAVSTHRAIECVWGYRKKRFKRKPIKYNTNPTHNIGMVFAPGVCNLQAQNTLHLPHLSVLPVCERVWFPPHFSFLSANVHSFANTQMLSLKLCMSWNTRILRCTHSKAWNLSRQNYEYARVLCENVMRDIGES